MFDGSPEDALLEVHLRADVFVYVWGCVLTLGRVNAEAGTAHEGKGLVLAAHSFVKIVREYIEVAHEGEKPSSRAKAASARPLRFLGFCKEVRKTPRARNRLGVS
jgi:hypothetical protein